MTADGSLQLQLPADMSAARRARNAVRTRLYGLVPQPAMEDLVLAISEMVTMVLRTATGAVDFRVMWRSAVVRVEVRDGPTEIRPGLGGEVLTRLSTRWGIDSTPPTVWAEIANLRDYGQVLRGPGSTVPATS